ncbi:ATL57 [Symbiodinium sp. CCMP2592]|nr:ATL57 [Symbiodinium sp. CCMP2592]
MRSPLEVFIAWRLSCSRETSSIFNNIHRQEVVDLRDCESSTHFREGRGYSNTTCQTLDILGPECSESSVSSPRNLDVIDGLDLDSVLRALVNAEDSENSEAGGLSALLANTVYIDGYRDDACSDSDSTVPSEEDTALLPPTAVAPSRVQMDSIRQQQLQPSLSSVDWPELVQSHRSSACSGYSAGAMSVESPASSTSRDRPGHTSLQAGSLEASIQELFDAQSVESASAPNSARSETVSMARGFDAAEETLSVVDIADELPVSPQSDDGQSMHIVYGASVAVSPRSFASPRIENMGSLLQRWALEHQLDENVASSIRRVLEIPDLIPDVACLTEEEVYALPKVRFTAKDTQQCSICLEAFEEGELLTALPCGHFFHVECVAGWMQRATICPLCRASCAD